MFSACALQYAFGVISPNTSNTNVIIPVAIPTPTLPNNVIERSVVIAAAETFARLLPISNVVSILLGFDFSFWRDFAPRLFSLRNFFNCPLLIEIKATSRPLKYAEVTTMQSNATMENAISTMFLDV